MTIHAKVVHESAVDASELIEVGNHEIQFGGQGDGFCYSHQSFDCLDNLTDEERAALNEC